MSSVVGETHLLLDVGMDLRMDCRSRVSDGSLPFLATSFNSEENATDLV